MGLEISILSIFKSTSKVNSLKSVVPKKAKGPSKESTLPLPKIFCIEKLSPEILFIYVNSPSFTSISLIPKDSSLFPSIKDLLSISSDILNRMGKSKFV